MFTFIAIYLAIGYHQGISELITDCKQEKVEVFGKTYKNHKELYGDFNFMSDVFSVNQRGQSH